MPNNKLKEQLIKLGSQRPDLRKHLRPILDSFEERTAYSTVDDMLDFYEVPYRYSEKGYSGDSRDLIVGDYHVEKAGGGAFKVTQDGRTLKRCEPGDDPDLSAYEAAVGFAASNAHADGFRSDKWEREQVQKGLGKFYGPSF